LRCGRDCCTSQRLVPPEADRQPCLRRQALAEILPRRKGRQEVEKDKEDKLMLIIYKKRGKVSFFSYFES